MHSAKNRLGQPQSIAIFRALVLGDLLCTVPAFRAVREAYPQAEITLIGLPWAKSFVERFSNLFDDFLSFPGYPGLPETEPALGEIPQFFRQAQRREFDLAIQMHGSGPFVNPIVVLLGAKCNAGFHLPGDYCPDAELFMPFPQEGHEIFKYLQLTSFLGLPVQSTELEFPLIRRDETEFQSIEGVQDFCGKDYVCIHAGSRLLSRRWLSERFAQTADQLASLGLTVVLTGSRKEEPLVHGISEMMQAPHVNLVGKTTLGALGVLLSKARLLISNDTGISHVACALKVPSVIVVTGSDPRRWAPLDYHLHKCVYSPVGCRPCSFDVCPIGQPCAQGISTQDVVAAAQEILSEAWAGELSSRGAVCNNYCAPVFPVL